MKGDKVGLDVLLSMDGEIFPMDNGYWTKFEVKRVEISAKMPHGIKYSLTLHDRNNHRVFGIDNVHGFKPKRKKYVAKKLLGIICIKKRKFYPMNLNLLQCC